MARRSSVVAPLTALAFALGACAGPVSIVRIVQPTVQTVPVQTEGDAADDPAVWVHPSSPERSTIIGTDKTRGLLVYDLAGRLLQDIPDGRMNNVDVVYGFTLGDRTVDLAGATNRTDDSIALYEIDQTDGTLRSIAARPILTGIESVYGFCFLRSAVTGRFYAFLNNKEGVVQQWRLFERDGKVDAELVRAFPVGGLTEGIVASASTNALFVGEERVGVWKYEAEPAWLVRGVAKDSPGVPFERPRRLVAAVGRDPLVADVEGLAVYPMDGEDGGYLLVSSQGDSTFAVFGLRNPHTHLFSFRLGRTGSIDEVSGTDGIEVVAAALGPAFPRGVFVAQDDERPGSTQNFKLVPWERVEDASEGLIRGVRGWDPRARPLVVRDD